MVDKKTLVSIVHFPKHLFVIAVESETNRGIAHQEVNKEKVKRFSFAQSIHKATSLNQIHFCMLYILWQ